MDYGLRMRLAGRFLAFALSMGVAIPLAALGGLSVHAAPAQSGPYVRDTTALGGGTGTVTGIATLNDDSIFVASSLGDGTGVLDIMDNPGDNVTPDDDLLTFPSGVLGVAANQVDDTAYFVTGSPVAWMTQASAVDSDWVAAIWGGPTGQQKFVAVADGGSGDRVADGGERPCARRGIVGRGGDDAECEAVEAASPLIDAGVGDPAGQGTVIKGIRRGTHARVGRKAELRERVGRDRGIRVLEPRGEPPQPVGLGSRRRRR